jgi:hypothetical protein
MVVKNHVGAIDTMNKIPHDPSLPRRAPSALELAWPVHEVPLPAFNVLSTQHGNAEDLRGPMDQLLPRLCSYVWVNLSCAACVPNFFALHALDISPSSTTLKPDETAVQNQW